MNLIRTAIERLSRGRVLRRHILVNNAQVALFVTPDAQLKYLKVGKAAFDQDLIGIAETHLTADSVVWDIGANIGVFSFAAARISRKTVVAIEGDLFLAQIMQRTVNELGQQFSADVVVLPVAVGEKVGIEKFLIAKRGRASNALASSGGYSMMGGVRFASFVPVMNIDTLAETLPKPTFIKIDIEGAEELALRGATTLLRSTRPIVYTEISDRTQGALEKIFTANDYVARDLTGQPVGATWPSNVFFVPKEQVESFAARARASGART